MKWVSVSFVFPLPTHEVGYLTVDIETIALRIPQVSIPAPDCYSCCSKMSPGEPWEGKGALSASLCGSLQLSLKLRESRKRSTQALRPPRCHPRLHLTILVLFLEDLISWLSWSPIPSPAAPLRRLDLAILLPHLSIHFQTVLDLVP